MLFKIQFKKLVLLSNSPERKAMVFLFRKSILWPCCYRNKLKFRKITHIVGIKGMSSIVCVKGKRDSIFLCVLGFWYGNSQKQEKDNLKWIKVLNPFYLFVFLPGFQVFVPWFLSIHFATCYFLTYWSFYQSITFLCSSLIYYLTKCTQFFVNKGRK